MVEELSERSQIPLGWESVLLGDLLLGIEAGKSFTCEQRPATAEEWGVIKVSAMTWGTFDEAENKAVPKGKPFDAKNEIKEGDILLSRSNTEELVGATVLVGACRRRLLLSDKSMRLIYPHSLSPQWLQRMLASPSVRSQISSMATGTSDSMRNVSQEKVRAVNLLLPPKNEQERIVSKIDEVFSEIEEGERALERVQKLVERYRQSVLKAAVTGELTREWREKHKGKVESGEALLARILKARRESWENSELQKMKAKGQKPTNNNWKSRYPLASEPRLGLADGMPDGWAQLSLEQCTLAERPIAYGVLQPGEDQADGVLLIRVCDIADGVVDQENLKKIGHTIAEMFPRTQLQGGEVLLTLVGTIGRTAIVPTKLAGANVARAVGMLAPGVGVLSEWLEICLRYSKTRQSMTENAREVARKTLNLEQVREHAVPIPSEAEQGEAVSIVNELLSRSAKFVREITGQIAASRALRQSTLKAAFSGKLVPQNPTDEPAFILLERIAAERNRKKTKTAPKTTRRKKANA